MKQKGKRLLAHLMIAVLLASQIPADMVQASETGTVSGMTEMPAVDAGEEADQQEAGTAEEAVQTEAEAVEEAVQTEAEAVEETAQTEAEAVEETAQTEAEAVEEAAQAEEAIDVPEERKETDEAITEGQEPVTVETEEETFTVEPPIEETQPQEEFAVLDEKMTTKTASKVEDKESYILAAGEWAGGHYVWYINDGAARHYIFCMDKGKTMRSGVFKPSVYSGPYGTAENTFRITVALDYFQSHGGWGSQEGYMDTQYAIWNQGPTDTSGALLSYSHYLWQLTEKNAGRASGWSSYEKTITAVKKSQTDSVSERKKISANIKRLIRNQDNREINSTISLSGSAWRYFANSGNWGSGGITVVGCYGMDGKKLDSNTASASVGADGNLSIHVKEKDSEGNAIATGKDDTVTIIMQVGHDYAGATSMEYLRTGSDSNQTMAYDADFSSPAYFAVKVYATPNPEPKPTKIQVNKIDEFGTPVDGAVFRVTDGVEYNEPLQSGEYLEFGEESTGCNYAIVETQAPDGMDLYKNQYNSPVPAQFKVEEKTENGITALYIANTFIGDGVAATPGEDGMSYSYTVTDTYSDGDAVLHKIGNIFVAYENGHFVYRKRDLEHVRFELHAAENIYAGDMLLFSAGQLLTNEVLNASPWNSVAGHNASISNETDADGNIYYNNLPCGSYYVLEKESPYTGYWVSGSRYNFTINKFRRTQINEDKGGSIDNEPVYAGCLVWKKEKQKNEDGSLADTGKPLAGAEFTLYAHISNTSFDGYSLFTVDQTRPAVVSRLNGMEQTVSNQWIPLETLVSNKDGEAYFDMQLPYGRYMVVETYPPANPDTGELYALAEESFEFTHTAGDSDSFVSGALFTHTFYDEAKSNVILVRKTGEVLTDAKTVETEYGTYRQLQYEPLSVEDVTFEIYDSSDVLVDTIKTDKNGEAKSGDLNPGVYYVKETQNGGSMKLDTEPKQVVLKKNETQLVQTAVVEFTNESLDTVFKIYKTAEEAELSGQLPDGVSRADDIYTYVEKKVSDVVFAVFTKKDIANYDGTTVVKAGSCVGYCVTDKNGTAEFTEKLVSGDYYWKEIKTKDDTYIKDTGTYDFNVKLDGENIVKDLNRKTPLLNKKYKGSIKVIKTDGKTKMVLEGVTFTLYDQNKTVLGTFKTDKNGEILVGNLPIGTYYVQEKETLAGYKLDEGMREINLTKSNLDQILEIENDSEDNEIDENENNEIDEKDDGNDSDSSTSITIRTSSTISGRGNVKTGDAATRIMAIFLMLSVIGFLLLKKEKEMKKIMNRMKRIFMAVLLLIGAVTVMPPKSVQAAESVEISNANVYIDGEKCTVKRIEFVSNGNGQSKRYHLEFITEKGEYISSREYEIIEEKNGDGNTFSLRANNQDASFILIGYSGSDEALTVPKNISLSCNVTVEDSQSWESYTEMLAESGNIEDIGFPDTVYHGYSNVIIPSDSKIERIQKYNTQDGRLESIGMGDIYSIFRTLYLTSYKPDVSMVITNMNNDQGLQDVIKEHIMVYYNSWIGGHFRIFNLEPSYIKGKINYEMNGGTNSNPDEYIIGDILTLVNLPSRKDYRFCGWFTNKDFAAESALSKDADGNYFLSSDKILSDTITLYARWEYSVTVTRDGINYQIAADKSVSVIQGDYSGEIVVADHISYNGNQYPVTGISARAFRGKDITAITLPDTINTIEEGAFADCRKLKDVYLDSMSLSLGDAFNKSVNLHAYAASEAYQRYEADGYTGTKIPYESKITYVLNGGTNHPENPDTYTWKSMLLLQEPSKDKCRFDGWYTDSAFQEASRVETICEDTYKDIVLYARFTPTEAGAVASDELTGPKEDSKDENVKNENTQNENTQNGNTDNKNTENGNNSIANEAEKTENENPDGEKTVSAAKAEVKSIKLSNQKGKKLKITVKAENAAVYQIKYSTSKEFKKKQTKTITTTKKTYTAKKLKKGKTYYVKVRAYSYDTQGNKVYEKWSTVKKIKIKK